MSNINKPDQKPQNVGKIRNVFDHVTLNSNFGNQSNVVEPKLAKVEWISAKRAVHDELPITNPILAIELREAYRQQDHSQWDSGILLLSSTRHRCHGQLSRPRSLSRRMMMRQRYVPIPTSQSSVVDRLGESNWLSINSPAAMDGWEVVRLARPIAHSLMMEIRSAGSFSECLLTCPLQYRMSPKTSPRRKTMTSQLRRRRKRKKMSQLTPRSNWRKVGLYHSDNGSTIFNRRTNLSKDSTDYTF